MRKDIVRFCVATVQSARKNHVFLRPRYRVDAVKRFVWCVKYIKIYICYLFNDANRQVHPNQPTQFPC
jgi:hypothetical protein